MKKYVSELHLTNYKKHEQLSAKIEGRHFLVSGGNGIGKSTIFQAILRLLGNSDNKPDVPIKQGAESAEIKQILGADGQQYMVREKFTKGRSRVSFFRLQANGMKEELTPAIEQIQKIFGNVADMTPIIDMTGKDQFDFLREKVGLDVSGYQNLRDNKVEDRQLAKRELKSLQAKVNDPENYVVADDIKTYTKEKPVEELLQKKNLAAADVTKADKQISDANDITRRRQEVARDITDIDAQIKLLTDRKEKLQQYLTQTPKPDLDTLSKTKAAAILAVQKIDLEFTELAEHNKMVGKVTRFNKATEELATVTKKVASIDAEISKMDKDLRQRLADIPLGELYEGLELKYKINEETEKLEEVGLYLRGLPFNKRQQSHGEMIRVLIALSTLVNPDGLNFVWIPDWSMLDDKNREEILAFARDQENVQLGIEKVDNNVEIVTEFIEHE